eukprot:3137911-Rhodomonas_salina.1
MVLRKNTVLTWIEYYEDLASSAVQRSTVLSWIEHYQAEVAAVSASSAEDNGFVIDSDPRYAKSVGVRY